MDKVRKRSVMGISSAVILRYGGGILAPHTGFYALVDECGYYSSSVHVDLSACFRVPMTNAIMKRLLRLIMERYGEEIFGPRGVRRKRS